MEEEITMLGLILHSFVFGIRLEGRINECFETESNPGRQWHKHIRATFAVLYIS